MGDQVLLIPAESCMAPEADEGARSPEGGAGGSRVCLSSADEAVDGRLENFGALGGVASLGMVGTTAAEGLGCVRE